MALLNYTLPPFPNLPTPAPFFHQPNQPSPVLFPPLTIPNNLQRQQTNPNNNNNPYSAYVHHYQQRADKIAPNKIHPQPSPNTYLPQPPPPPPAQQPQQSSQQLPPQQINTEQSNSEQFQKDFNTNHARQQRIYGTPQLPLDSSTNNNNNIGEQNPQQHDGSYPTRPIEYRRIDPDSQKTSIHPIIDYDNDYEYYDDETGHPKVPLITHVTPIQGPILLKNGTVPVVPLYSYPLINNGTFVQIPIFWTALSIALGWELRGEIIRGVPCIKKYHQLFCPTAGNSYPIDKIELFIDENKALMKRMYGDFSMSPPESNPARGATKKRSVRHSRSGNHTLPPWISDLYSEPLPDPFQPHNNDDKQTTDANNKNGESYFAKLRRSRQSSRPPSSAIPNFRNNQSNESGRLDVCESKVEIVTPYWASNSAGKIRAIVNTQHFEQAIHQEVCSKQRTSRCGGDCGCEQKYKWHRLLAYDPDNDCKGIFMDWFLFPSCCVCRCNPT